MLHAAGLALTAQHDILHLPARHICYLMTDTIVCPGDRLASTVCSGRAVLGYTAESVLSTHGAACRASVREATAHTLKIDLSLLL